MSNNSLIKDLGPIDSYTDEDLKDWLDIFNNNERGRMTIPECPFLFYEVRREWIRRGNCREEPK